MHSSENARRAQQRRRPELNIDTAGTARSLTRDSRPLTPPNRKPAAPSKSSLKPSAGTRALKAPSPSHNVRDADDVGTFLDDMITPVDMSADKENDRPAEPARPNYRDSHDLSLPSRHVRESLVSNMLLSLDQFSMGQMGANQFGPPRPPYDDPLFALTGGEESSRTMTSTTRTGRLPPTAGHGYSYSSDFEGADDASRVSSSLSRGRRSNSSSGFQSSLGRINSMRETGTPRMLHSRGGKGSKSSSSNSIDAGYAQVLGSQRWAHGFGGRSNSFDHGHRPPVSFTPQQPLQPQQQQQPWHIEFSNNFFNNENYDDAAPTPTVPGGPRRLATVPSMPILPPPEPMGEPPGIEHKRSTRSTRSATVGRQTQPKKKDVPPVPPFDLDSAPAPHVGYEKAKEPVPVAAVSQQPQPPKERPGFFRRVFGSFRDTPSEPSTSHSNKAGYVSSTSVETAGSKGHNAPDQKSQSTPPSRESHHSFHGTLQKKPSNFFRRRKKSVAEPPPLPLPKPTPAEADPSPAMPPMAMPIDKAGLLAPKAVAEPSPVTSLRRAMNPYLKTSSSLTPDTSSPALSGASGQSSPAAQSDQEDVEPTPRNVRGFSPDYEPPPSATIRSIGRDSAGPTSPDTPKRHIETPTRNPPAPPLGVRAGSFLNDNSDSEDSPDRSARQRPLVDRALNRDLPALPHKLSTPSIIATPPNELSSPKTRLEITDEDDARGSKLTLPIEGAPSRQPSPRLSKAGTKSASSLPSVKLDKSDFNAKAAKASSTKPIDEPEFVVGEPTEDERYKAQKIFEGSEEFIQKDRAAAWMGEEGPVRQRTLRAYMDLHDFKNQSIVMALRDVCARLVLRAETQQVDRILVAFSNRWCACNPSHGFKSTDVIHTTCYSIMLLNTDLHLADIEQKMTRSQFIKNTLTTIRQALSESVPEAFARPSILPGRSQNLGVDDNKRPSIDQERTASFRNSFMAPLRLESALGQRDDPDDCGPLVKSPFEGNQRAWETQLEVVLKDIYNSIRDERLPLFGAEPAQTPTAQGGLSVMGMLKRSPSVLSKAPSEGQASARGRVADAARHSASRWTSKSRSRPRLQTAAGFSSSRTSFDDNNSVWSPTVSSATWSRYSLGRTQTSMSMDSFGSSWPRGDYQQSIGFANALSQAIIREDVVGSMQSLVSEEMREKALLDDESLELAGPPWVKEGMVVHKHHLDGIDKKAKDRNWTEVFAVIQKGQMSLFSFTPNKSMRSKGRHRQNVPKGGVVGGGNWQENATNLGTFNLKQTLASALPPPGYSRQRPHVWALSLPTGAVHLFQVGTPEIIKEFVTTANYWSARLSTHPMVGAVSNIEYGWSDAIVNSALVNAVNTINDSHTNLPGTRPGSAAAGRASMQSRGSFRSGSLDFGHVRTGSSSGVFPMAAGSSSGSRKLPGDRIHVAEWTPPTQSLRPSHAGETEQLATLLGYVRGIEEELQAHNALRSPMLLAFTPRGTNSVRAMGNWEKKSAYLLREIVKFRTYVDCLAEAEWRRAEIYKERDVAQRAARGEEEVEDDGAEPETPASEATDLAREFGARGADTDGDRTLRA